jgi:SAM-dependent methyltransferase
VSARSITRDDSLGWNDAAGEFIEAREDSDIGVEVVRAWARSLGSGTAVLDLGCGSGAPIAQLLSDVGLQLYGVDASPRLVARFRDRFPNARVSCEPVQTSRFFDCNFDGIIAIGLMFLLPVEEQQTVVQKVGSALTPGGSFLFTAPQQPCEWNDSITGRESRSLGHDRYVALLATAGLRLVANHVDEGENYYFDVRRL